MTVVDASAIVDLLIPPDEARREFLIEHLPDPATPWLAPDVLPFEVYSVVRRQVLRAAISDSRAARALQLLLRLPIEFVPTHELIPAAWPLRERFAAADSLYAALSLRAVEPLLTTDRRLGRAATSAGIEVRIPQ